MLNALLKIACSLVSRKIRKLVRTHGVGDGFLFVRHDERQRAEIGARLEAWHIRPVIDKVFLFNHAKEALAHLAPGRAVVKVVVKVR